MEILLFIGLAIVFIGSIGFLIAAFKESVWWLIGCIILSPIAFVFLLLHWQKAKNPFFLQLIGIAVIVTGAYLGEGY